MPSLVEAAGIYVKGVSTERDFVNLTDCTGLAAWKGSLQHIEELDLEINLDGILAPNKLVDS